MMRGYVSSNKEAIISLVVRNFSGLEQPIEAVIDTGFDGYLTLPERVITALNMPYLGTTRVIVADNRLLEMELFEATVLWDNQLKEVIVISAPGEALIGMSLLEGYRLSIDVRIGGSVIIEIIS